MQIQSLSFAAYVNASKTKKYGNHFWPRYMSPLKGKLVRVPKKLTGELPTRATAEEWLAKNIHGIITNELKKLASQEWTSNVTMVKHFTNFSAARESEIPKSAKQDLSMLKNFGIPYFIQVAKEPDPNLWWKQARQFKAWLTSEAFNRNGKKISISTANATINSVNHFLKWMRDEEVIAWENFRPFEAFAAGLKNERSDEELIDEKERALISARMHAYARVYGDLFDLQAECGFRVGELVGLPFIWLSDQCPEYLKEAFAKIGMPVVGSIYLESQPANPHLKIENGVLPRKELKWRKEISVACSRTVPILTAKIWNMLSDRYEHQKELFLKRVHGADPLSYLLFEGVHRAEYLEILRRTYIDLGIEPKGSHILRHTLSTVWEERGIPPKVAEITLGHKQASHEKYVRLVAKINRKAKYSGELKTFKKI